MIKQLSELRIGEIGKIKSIEGKKEIKRRLFDMGLTPSVDVLLKKKAPLGDPIEISVRGYELILRKSDASMIIVEV